MHSNNETSITSAETVLFVHAHPDDESITTGGTIAALVARGARVTVLTCTRGELGEVIPEDIRHLEGSAELGEHRANELTAAMAELGVTDHRFLGDTDARLAGLPPRRYRDSGMRWGAGGAEALDAVAPDALCAAEFGEIAADIASVVESIRPDAVVSYAADGGYGHPDHVMAHDASRRVAEVFAVPFFEITDPAVADLVIDVSGHLASKRAALSAHRSQVTVTGDTFALSSGPPRPIAVFEGYSRRRPPGNQITEWKDQGVATHVLIYILAVVLGLAIGGIATVNHQISALVAGVAVPWGIVAVLAVLTAFLAALRLLFPGRLVAGLGAIGALVAIGVLSLAGDGSSVLVPANPAGYALTYGAVFVVMVALAWPAAGTFSGGKIGTTAKPKGIVSP